MNAAPASMPATPPRMSAALRRIGLLLPRSGLLRRRRLSPGTCLLRRGRARTLASRRGRFRLRPRGLDAAERRLEVVEDEADRRIGAGRGGDRRFALADDEDAALPCRDLELRQRRSTRLQLLRRREQLRCGSCKGLAVGKRRAGDLALVVEDDGSLDLG